MKKQISRPIAHLLAAFTVCIWGTTFIVSKILLRVYSPAQIMLMRFFIAYISLFLLKPRRLKLRLKEEMACALLGLTGGTLYFLLENYALMYTLACNVSILVTIAPILIAILAHFFLPNEPLDKRSFGGFFMAMLGVAFVVFNGTVVLQLNPLGDILAIGAALCWAIYSILLKKQVKQYDQLMLTRRIMLWGFITALPVVMMQGETFVVEPLTQPIYLMGIFYLGVLGSGIGFMMWNMAVHKLGAVVTNNYIYINPFSTMIAAIVILKEPLSFMGAVGAILILLGVFISDQTAHSKSDDRVMTNKRERH